MILLLFWPSQLLVTGGGGGTPSAGLVLEVIEQPSNITIAPVSEPGGIALDEVS